MKIEDLIIILNNRLREFKLSKDYATMSGDLKRMNAADKEINALEDTLYQLSLLVDASKSAVVKETTLAEAITDGSVSVLSEYDISSYATDPLHEQKIMDILSKMGVMDGAEKIDDYIKGKYESSPVTGEMVWSAGLAFAVDVRLMMAIMQLDSRFGTVGIAIGTLNPGNVGNDDDGNTRTYDSWQAGVTAVAEWLSRHRITENEEIVTEEVVEGETETATSTPQTTTPEIVVPTETSTSTPTVATTTPETTTPLIDPEQATTTPEIVVPTEIATTTINTATSTTTTN